MQKTLKQLIAEKGEQLMERTINNMHNESTKTETKTEEKKKPGRKKLTDEERKERKKALNHKAYERKKMQMQKEAVVYFGSIKDELDIATKKGRELEAIKNSCDAMERKVREKFYTSNSLLKDQTAKADAGKPQLSLVPMDILTAIAKVRAYGNKKYHDPNNWKTVEVSRYRDALLRHMVAYINDPKSVDEESGLLHRDHMACNMAFLIALEK